MRATRALLVLTTIPLIAAVTATAPAHGQTQLCFDAASLDPIAELEASPRENENAELLALRPGRGLAADSGTYSTIAADLDRIALEYPEIAEIPAHFNIQNDTLFVHFEDAATRDLAEAGEIPDFECLNEWLDLDFARWYEFLERTVLLEFDGNYKMEEVAAFYERIPGVSFTEYNVSLILGDAGCFYQTDDGKRTYFFEEWVVLFPASGPVRLAKVEVGGGQVSLVDDEEPPYHADLAQEYLDCQAGLLGGPQVVEVPTASTVALGLLAALLATAGLWISRRATPI